MPVHVIADRRDKLATLRLVLPARLEPHFHLLSDVRGMTTAQVDAVVIAVDIRMVENIAALKDAMRQLGRAERRIFLISDRSHVAQAQAYALGATRVLHDPVSPALLIAQLSDQVALNWSPSSAAGDAISAASLASARLSKAFAAVASGMNIDVTGMEEAAIAIADSVMDDGLSNWLATVRQHHEGTYQHCLLVAGIAVDFGVSLGVPSADIRRLAVAATFHDIGKACIPLDVLDKPGKLDPEERAVIETHSSLGHFVLKDTPGISAEVLGAVRHHHEFLDGSGYPDGLVGDSIPDIVRLLTISDIFGALIEDRRYKAPMSRKDAYEILLKMRGKLEAPLVAAFRQVALGQ
ncbi:HD-GYP domain-containing protein [Rhodopseudomonas palustris]|uniref:HD domain-containing protein n=1 Tax=Rhodopseudomonas palustris TaxID=1076 RepID=A0A418UXJ0_RHOPL|nr:HD domain-containing phosphohydrolase [Rhodopseudomonas palustris]RJF65656.1 HD domain-containing protein [Rhodopseudomonas palustris]